MARGVLIDLDMHAHNASRSTLATTVILSSALTLAGCAGADEPESGDGPEPVGTSEEAQGGSVADAEASSCSTSSVKGLSLQIIAEGNCISPGAYAEVPSLSNVSFGSTVFRYLEKPAKDHLVSSLKAHPGTHMTVYSMLRTVAQQYLLYRWYKEGRCGIPLAATPGTSNHETGLAMDIGPYSTWKTSLQNHGFHWLGSSDSSHFDYAGSGAVSHKGLDVKAFQRLWNRNHPGDKIAVDGDYGPQTEARLKKSPAGGFAKGAICQQANDLEMTCDHPLSVAGEPLSGFCSSCAFQVCSDNASCCADSWSQACVDAANQLCPGETGLVDGAVEADAEGAGETGVAVPVEHDRGPVER